MIVMDQFTSLWTRKKVLKFDWILPIQALTVYKAKKIKYVLVKYYIKFLFFFNFKILSVLVILKTNLVVIKLLRCKHLCSKFYLMKLKYKKGDIFVILLKNSNF